MTDPTFLPSTVLSFFCSHSASPSPRLGKRLNACLTLRTRRASQRRRQQHRSCPKRRSSNSTRRRVKRLLLLGPLRRGDGAFELGGLRAGAREGVWEVNGRCRVVFEALKAFLFLKSSRLCKSKAPYCSFVSVASWLNHGFQRALSTRRSPALVLLITA